MRSFDFNYFVKRGEVLNEMARPVSMFSSISPELNKIYANLLKSQQAQGVSAAATRQIIIWRFFIDAINDFLDIYHTDEGELSTSLEITKKLTGKTDHDSILLALTEILKNNKELLRNQKFMQYISDLDNIDRFKNYAGFGVSKSTSKRRMGRENELTDVTGHGISEFEQTSSNARDLVLAMNKIMGNRKRKKLSNNGNVTDSVSDNYNPNMDYAHGIIDAIETIIDSKNEYMEEVQSGQIEIEELPRDIQVLVNSKSVDADLNYIKGMYETMISDNTGTTPEEFNIFLSKLKRIRGMTPERSKIFDLLSDEISNLDDHELINIPDSEKKYKGYDSDVIEKVLDTPEKKDAFDDWFRKNTSWRKAKNDKLEQLLMNKMLNLQIQSNPKLQGIDNDEMFLNPAIQQYMVSIQGYQKMLDSTSNPEKEKNLIKKIAEIQAKISQIRGNSKKYVPDEDENRVMESFVKSLESTFYKPNGKFVDRGFKKHANYGQWIMNDHK
jgi:hypothetical protein